MKSGGDSSRWAFFSSLVPRASRQRFTGRSVFSTVCESLFGVWAFALMPDAGRVAPISGSVLCLRLVALGPPYHTTKALLAEYLASYTNTLQLIDYQYFTQCKILSMPPTRNLHNPHTATRHKYGREISQHRGTEKSVAPTDFSTSLWRITHRIRQNRMRSSGVWCVRCMQESVRYFEIILHSWNLCISTCYVQKV